MLDLCYVEDRDAEVDANIVMTDANEFVEIQGSGEEAVFSQAQLDQLLALGKKGIAELCALQDEAIRAADLCLHRAIGRFGSKIPLQRDRDGSRRRNGRHPFSEQ